MDITLHYIEEGTGTPLLLLHGNGEDGTYFKHQLAYFSKKYRVIAVDTRGHGQSPRGAAPFTISQFAEDLNAFLEERKIERAVLLGFSDGANIAMRFAMKHQEKLLALMSLHTMYVLHSSLSGNMRMRNASQSFLVRSSVA